MTNDSGERKKLRVGALWRALVRYVNHDLCAKEFEELAKLGFEVVGCDQPTGLMELSEELIGGETIDQLADRYRVPLRQVLLCLLSDFGTVDYNMMKGTLQFLKKHTKNRAFLYDIRIRAIVKRYPGEPRVSVISGICHFLLGEVERHRGRGEQLRKVFPIAVCERPGCGRFIFVQRTGRARFCSESCRVSVSRSKLPLEDKAAYMREYRASQKKAREIRRAPSRRSDQPTRETK